MEVPDFAFEIVRKGIAKCNQLMKQLKTKKDVVTWRRIKERSDCRRHTLKIIMANGVNH